MVFLALAATLICGFIVFGLLVFSSALNITARNDSQLLAAIARRMSSELPSDVHSPIDSSSLSRATIEAGSEDFTTLLIDHAGQIVAMGPMTADLQEMRAHLPTDGMLRNRPASGDFHLEMRRYLWSSVPVTNTPFVFAVVHRTPLPTLRIYLRQQTVPILVVIVLILGASYLTATRLRRLQSRISSLDSKLLDLRLRDPVSHLPSRALFEDRVAQNLHLSRREGRNFIILCLQLAPLDELMHNMPREAQEQTIKQVAGILQSTLRSSDTLCYVDNSMFLAHLPATDSTNAKVIAHKLISAFHDTLNVGEHSFYLRCRIGISIYPMDGADGETLIKNAQLAMSVCAQANNDFMLYDASLDYFNVQRLSFINNLRRAIHQDKLELYYQPKIALRNGAITGAEVLVRWRNDQGQLIMPNEFISLAEQTGLIAPLTQWVLNTSLRQCADLHRHFPGLHIAVNISAYNLHDNQLEQYILSKLNTWKISPRHLALEITESAMMRNQARAMELLNRLTALGIRISVDDFGTGYSSLSYLRKLPLTELKIDKSFVINMAHDDNDVVIIRTIIDLAHDMGLHVVAEGIENDQALRHLVAMGCDTGQGYFISPPLTFGEFIHWVGSNGVYHVAGEDYAAGKQDGG